jgi:high-affinity nickel-transport protein
MLRGKTTLRRRLGLLYLALIAANLGAWLWAFVTFRGSPIMLSTALLAYGLGLRHAVDADHIAAIDNVTRKLMQQKQRPVCIGFFFAIGHAAVVLIAAVAVALTASALGNFKASQGWGGIIATTVSATFLFTIAIMNLAIFRSVLSTFRKVRSGGTYAEEDIDRLLAGQGFIARLLRPLFRLITRSWHMAPLGFLFGLGFDTATEVALLGLSASQAAQGISISTILVFPALFAAGMTLIDTTDGVLMLGAYEWAQINPVRKLYYNLSITLVSALIALTIGMIEAAALIGKELDLGAAPWQLAETLAGSFNGIGFGIVALFAVFWLASVLLARRHVRHAVPLLLE